MSGFPGATSGSQNDPSTPQPPAGVARASGTPLGPGQKLVTVSLRVNLDLSSNVDIFGYPKDTAINPVIVAATVSAADISGLFAYIQSGPSGEDISGSLGPNAAVPSTSVHGSTAAVAASVAAAATATSHPATNLDASNAQVFNAYAGTYSSYRTLGDLALAWAAQQMFSHPGATGVIDNDAEVIADINAAVAPKLNAALAALSQADLDAIVKTILGQDSSRGSKDGDNTGSSKSVEMFAGDVIIVRVNLKDFTATNANANQKVVAGDYGLAAAAQQYDLVLTLA